jgi:hypothetical protein
MFSDRLWILKAAAALGLLALLCTTSHRKISERFPQFELVALSPDSFRGHVFHLSGQRVVAADARSFQIGTSVGPMRLLTPTPPPVDSYVTFNARAVGIRTLEVVELFVHSGYGWKRPLNYGISIVTVIGYLWLVRRRFRWRPEDGVIRGRY